MGYVLQLGQPQRRLSPFQLAFICFSAMDQMGFTNSGLALGSLGPGGSPAMKLALLGSADLQRRLTALLSGVLTHRCAPDAENSAATSK